VLDLPAGPLTPWAELTLDALRSERERDRAADGPLPRALREAPPPVGPGGPDELAGGLLVPLRSGVILTRRAVAAGADQVGAGQRIGNRRRALGAMLAAEPERTARWLAGQADHWTRRHRSAAAGAAGTPGTPGQTAGTGSAGGDRVQHWWADRAAGTARLFREGDAAGGHPATDWVSAAD
jgi:hypothetical protein